MLTKRTLKFAKIDSFGNAEGVHAALDVLIEQGVIKYFMCGGTKCIDLNPASLYYESDAYKELYQREGISGAISYYGKAIPRSPHSQGVRANSCIGLVNWDGAGMPEPAFRGWSMSRHDDGNDIHDNNASPPETFGF